jgi:hypothetical protein
MISLKIVTACRSRADSDDSAVVRSNEDEEGESAENENA